MRVVILTASAMVKEINNQKYSGKCVTALNCDSGKVVRFVSNERGAPMENPWCNNFCPLDIFDISIIKKCPLNCQTENVLADYPHAEKRGKYHIRDIQDIYALYVRGNPIAKSYMLDGSHKLNDISGIDHSLELIRVSDLQINDKKCSFMYKRRRFQYIGVTDTQYRGQEIDIGDAYLAVSIPADNYYIEGEPKGYFKFAAAVFPVAP